MGGFHRGAWTLGGRGTRAGQGLAAGFGVFERVDQFAPF